MNELELVVPNEKHEAAVSDFLLEHRAAGEEQIHGGALIETMSYADWLEWGRRTLHWEWDLADDEPVITNEEDRTDRWVPSSTFFALRKSDGKLVGIIDFRRELNDILRSFAGQIGYGVRPSERGKGYGSEMLGLVLREGDRLGIQRPVMISCYADNEPSRRTILKWGGKLEREFVHPEEGKWVQVYMIDRTEIKEL